MTEERYPRIRYHMTNGASIIQDGLVMVFFIQRHHREISECIFKALETYCSTVGVNRLKWYNGEGESLPLDEHGWSTIHENLREEEGAAVELSDSETQLGAYRFEYYGRALGTGSYRWSPLAVSAVSFWFPTDYLEKQGPARVHDLAMTLARQLPFSTGYVSPAFNTMTDILGVAQTLLELSVRTPGMDILDLGVSMRLGTRPRGAYWMNFYGQPLLGELGGVATLREQLNLPGISIEQPKPDTVLVRLEEWPKTSGDMPAYRQLARVLAPHLYQETIPFFSAEDMRRWERRFLD